MIAIIVTYRSESTIVECVSAALSAGIEKVLVWDNSPDGQTEIAVETLPSSRITFVRSGQNPGFGGSVNAALESLSLRGDERLLVINPDCIISAEAIAGLSAVMAGERVAVAAPLMTYPNGVWGISGGSRPRLVKELAAFTQFDEILPVRLRSMVMQLLTRDKTGLSYVDAKSPGPPIDVSWVSGFCMMVDLKAFRSIGGFDEDYFLYFEDVDLCHRARLDGWRVVLARDVSAMHYESVSTSKVGKRVEYRRGMWTYFAKHGGILERAIAKRVMGVA